LGFRNTYAISYRNNGAVPAYNIDLKVRFDDEIVPLSADTPWNATYTEDTTHTFVWQIDTIRPYEGRTILLIDSVSVNADIGEMTKTTGYFEGNPNDCDLSDNLMDDLNEIVGAIDPNDILVFPEGSIQPTDTLTYKIRFQNIGTSPAQNVLILDTLSPHLDPTTLEMMAHSHDYDVVLDEHGVLHFRFNYIFLPDSNSNEPESHGFIQYRITPKASTPRGSKILNRAAIRFDFSEFLITNTVVSPVEDAGKLAQENALQVVVSPNPVESDAIIRLVSRKDAGVWVRIKSFQIYTTNGTIVQQGYADGQTSIEFDKNNLAAGVYIAKLEDENGFEHSGKFIIK
ncbi:MAG: T9SS type A sorting domain-containing protein, partial [Bacteroidota bacterium]